MNDKTILQLLHQANGITLSPFVQVVPYLIQVEHYEDYLRFETLPNRFFLDFPLVPPDKYIEITLSYRARLFPCPMYLLESAETTSHGHVTMLGHRCLI